tara:strand:- start:4061 stop:4267 length:207 start_codon:yes stop_codon:yes gene_type:complete
MRTWMPQTELQELLHKTFKSKDRACYVLGVTQPTLRKLFLNESHYTFKQLQIISRESKIPMIKIITML